MERIIIIMFACSLLASCGSASQCLAIPTCEEDEEHVESCKGEPDCHEVKMCGSVAYCVPAPPPDQCALEPMCQPGEEEVDSCDGLDNCRQEDTCAGTIYCVPGDIEASNFDQSCTVDDECLLINEGDPCECHVCPDAAINMSAETEYRDAIAAAMCTEMACPAIGCGEELLPHCNEGTCDLRQAKYASADGYDNTCETPEDCKGVFEGEVCQPCACPTTAINVSEGARYDEQFDVECNNGDILCDPCQIDVDCVDGVCELL